MTQLIIDKRTDAWKTDVNLLNRKWFRVVCNLIDNDTVCDITVVKRCRLKRCSWVSVQHILTTVMTHTLSLSMRVQTTLNHIRFDFYHNINVKEIVFFRARPRAWHIDPSTVVWTLIDNGKLANQIARLKVIVVKYCFASFRDLLGYFLPVNSCSLPFSFTFCFSWTLSWKRKISSAIVCWRNNRN